MEQFLKIFCRHCKLQPRTARLEGNCHARLPALVEHLQKKNLDVKIKRGHWLGEDVRPERRDHVAQQHSWVEMEVPDSSTVFYVDPTQFVFTGAEPSIGISTKDDYRYDPGGYTLRELCMGARQMPGTKRSPTHPLQAQQRGQAGDRVALRETRLDPVDARGDARCRQHKPGETRRLRQGNFHFDQRVRK